MTKSSKNLRLIIALSMLTAISIICGKYLAIRGGDVMRFSLENMPIILAGMVFGPVAGGLVGAVADLIGCVMVGYTINPIVTLGATAIGLISGGMPMLLKKAKINDLWITVITVATAHIIGSVVIKTLGLSAYYDMPFIILMLWRMLNYAIVGALDGVLVQVIKNNKGVKIQIDRLRGEEK
jgi:ECF transporter S component (folate family)